MRKMTSRVNFYLPAPVRVKLKAMAQAEKTSEATIIREAVASKLGLKREEVFKTLTRQPREERVKR